MIVNMAMDIIRDSNDGEVEIKKLGKPIKRTIVTPNTRVQDDGEEDVSGLNKVPERERPTSSKEVKKPTLLGNEGPDKNGKIDWDRNEDCINTILQYHETYQFDNTAEGFLKTGEKCYRQFNKLFKSEVTAQEIADALEKGYGPATKQGKTSAPARSVSDVKQSEPVEKDEIYFPIQATSLEIAVDKVPLEGTKLEICKILNCPNICVMQRKKGPPKGNKLFLAACKNSQDGKILEGCPQEEKLTQKEQFVLQMFIQQFNGDELQAKKFMYLSKVIREK